MKINKGNPFSSLTREDIDSNYNDFMRINADLQYDPNNEGQVDGFGFDGSEVSKSICLYVKSNEDSPYYGQLVFYVELNNGRFGEVICFEDSIPYVGKVGASHTCAWPLDKPVLPRIKYKKATTLKGNIKEGIQFTNDDLGKAMKASIEKRNKDLYRGIIKPWENYC
jgi:hypothetical protein